MFFKALLVPKDQSYSSIAFVMQNNPDHHDLSEYAMTETWQRQNFLITSRKRSILKKVSDNNRQANVGDIVGDSAHHRTKSFRFEEKGSSDTSPFQKFDLFINIS